MNYNKTDIHQRMLQNITLKTSLSFNERNKDISEYVKQYNIKITRISYNTKLTGHVPDVKRELVDSVAFHIDCSWDNNKYVGQVHARKFITYVTD